MNNTIVSARSRQENNSSGFSESYEDSVDQSKDSSQNIRRYYQVRSPNCKSSDYELACELKKYLLEQRKTQELLKCSRENQGLEELVRVFPNTGDFTIAAQEHHDTKSGFGKYHRDNFFILEGNGEEIATAEEFFLSKGYEFIDAKTCTNGSSLQSYMGQLRPFHSEELPSFYQKSAAKISSVGRGIRNHFRENSESYCVLGTVAGLLAIIPVGIYTASLFTRANESQGEKGIFRVMKEDFFGKSKPSQIYTIPANQPFNSVKEVGK